MNTAQRFQHKYTGIQVLIWHKTKEDASVELYNIKQNPDDWVWLDEVTINTINRT